MTCCCCCCCQKDGTMRPSRWLLCVTSLAARTRRWWKDAIQPWRRWKMKGSSIGVAVWWKRRLVISPFLTLIGSTEKHRARERHGAGSSWKETLTLLKIRWRAGVAFSHLINFSPVYFSPHHSPLALIAPDLSASCICFLLVRLRRSFHYPSMASTVEDDVVGEGGNERSMCSFTFRLLYFALFFFPWLLFFLSWNSSVYHACYASILPSVRSPSFQLFHGFEGSNDKDGRCESKNEILLCRLSRKNRRILDFEHNVHVTWYTFEHNVHVTAYTLDSQHAHKENSLFFRAYKVGVSSFL